jgi:uncharacterized protein YabN with tetrapyrrole methylase and pyrophosphatase domain
VPYLIEETYEAVEAIERGGDAALREELGDVLLQVVFHARIAEEEGRFDFFDVAASLAEKMVQRHPHVFAGQKLDSPQALRKMWHEHKMAGRESALDGIPPALPALQRAAKVSGAAAQAGFEWRHTGEIWDKAREELEEFRAAVEARNQPAPRAAVEARNTTWPDAGDSRETPPRLLPAAGVTSPRPRGGERPKAGGGVAADDAAETELGDLLFALVQLARWQRIDPESALRRSTTKFIERFRWMERRLEDQGGERFPEHWQALWAEAKAAVPG